MDDDAEFESGSESIDDDAGHPLLKSFFVVLAITLIGIGAIFPLISIIVIVLVVVVIVLLALETWLGGQRPLV